MLTLHKALLQIIISYGIIKDTELRSIYNELCIDINQIPNENDEECNKTFGELFQMMNKELKVIDLEIKTIVWYDENKNRIDYHGKYMCDLCACVYIHTISYI